MIKTTEDVKKNKRIKCHFCGKPIKIEHWGGVANEDGKEIWFHNWLPCLIQHSELSTKKKKISSKLVDSTLTNVEEIFEEYSAGLVPGDEEFEKDYRWIIGKFTFLINTKVNDALEGVRLEEGETCVSLRKSGDILKETKTTSKNDRFLAGIVQGWNDAKKESDKKIEKGKND